MKKVLFAIVMLTMVCLVGSSNATILSVTDSGLGMGEKISPAPIQVLDANVVNTLQQGFDEQQDVLLGADLNVDGGIIAAGARVSSHMIFLNVASGSMTHYGVQWEFDGQILGVMSDQDGTLEAASNSILGSPTTSYPAAFNFRGLESWNDGIIDEGYTIAGNVLTLGMGVSQPGDWVRVVTASTVPEPSTVILLGLGAIGLFVYGRRRRQI